jgi:hypothetical protein
MILQFNLSLKKIEKMESLLLQSNSKKDIEILAQLGLMIGVKTRGKIFIHIIHKLFV